jgi:peptidoglycan/LPS O-acetylase OafA/YrhL
MTTRPDPFLLTDPTPNRSLVPTLDGLRAISVLLVILMHFTEELPGMPVVIPGYLGLEIFFVISGFLITRLLLLEVAETGTVALGNFYFRRALRLTPALFAMVLAQSAFALASGYHDFRQSACALLYVTNYCATEINGLYYQPGLNLESTWSLAVEEHFYLFFPIILLTLFRRDIRALYVAVFAIFFGALAFRVGYALAGKSHLFVFWRTESTVDALMAGCAVSIMSTRDKGRSILRQIATLRTLGVVTAIYLIGECLAGYGLVGSAINLTVVTAWVATFIVNLLFHPDLTGARAFLNHPAMTWIGRISYSLYIWHAFVQQAPLIGLDFKFYTDWGSAILAIVASFALATASYYWIEIPILKRRTRWATKLGRNCSRSG